LKHVSKKEEAKLYPAVSYERNIFDVYDRDGKDTGVRVSHVVGDAGDPAILGQIIRQRTIHTAIVLGTQAHARLSPTSMDTRVMSIMLLLRKLWLLKNENVPMHVVGENQEDMTAQIALNPQIAFDKHGKLVEGNLEPDFINTQAIFARCLVQTLAYPVIRIAVQDLFDDSPGSADLVIVPASEYIIVNSQHEIKFGVAQQSVLLKKNERSILIGILTDEGDVLILPPHDSARMYTPATRLIIIRRYHNSIITEPVSYDPAIRGAVSVSPFSLFK